MMAVLPYSKESEGEYAGRLGKISAESERIFGTMDSTKMLRHMRMSYETAIGETDLEIKPIPIVSPVLLFVLSNFIKTWPGGKIKAPDFWSPPAEGDFADELKLLTDAQARFLERLGASPDEVNPHPIFGKMTVAQWSKLLGPHLNHHLRQFGA
jgi:hypothetical protein